MCVWYDSSPGGICACVCVSTRPHKEPAVKRERQNFGAEKQGRLLVILKVLKRKTRELLLDDGTKVKRGETSSLSGSEPVALAKDGTSCK